MPAHRNSQVIREMANEIYNAAWRKSIVMSWIDATDLAIAAHRGWEKIYREIYTRESG